jgi:hypothetical protein
MTDALCLYRCWQHNGQKMESCYPHTSPLTRGRVKGLKPGDTVKEPLRSADGQSHTMQVVRCKCEGAG